MRDTRPTDCLLAMVSILGGLAGCADRELGPEKLQGIRSVSLTPDSADLLPDGELIFAVVVVGENGQRLSPPSVAWRSTNSASVHVDSSGRLNAVAPGAAYIIASAGERADSSLVTVSPHVTFNFVAAASVVTCGVTNETGATFCWGSNFGVGLLGIGERHGVRPTPARVAGTPGIRFTSLALGYTHGCGLSADGHAYCWGSNQLGQLGTGRTDSTPHASPTLVRAAITFVELTAGIHHTCGRTESNEVYCWGYNLLGETGRGRKGSIDSVPGLVTGDLRFREVATGNSHTCGLALDGAPYCWGNGAAGLLGTDSMPAPECDTTDSPWCGGPVLVSGDLRLTLIDTRWDHTCGLDDAGVAYCWGSNRFFQLGAPTEANFSAQPVAVVGGEPWVALSTGAGHTCGVTASGTAYCWGGNGDGQLGVGEVDEAREPIAVATDLRFIDIHVGGNQTCAKAHDGLVYCWGSNFDGQLGVGDWPEGLRHSVPSPVLGQP